MEEPAWKWSLQVVSEGTNGPGDNTWGDYFACRKAAPDGSRWIATGFTMQGGKAPSDVRQHLVEFGV